jgi:radical SAM superfamily enzyme YgiQ (UPF0313 family)
MSKTFHKVLLVNPAYEASHYRTPSLLSGLGYVSEALIRAGIENRVIDMALGYSEADLLKIAREFNPDLFGFFLMTYRYRDHYRLIGQIRQAFPQATIVVGGPHLSTNREEVLESCAAVDYGVVREGEETLVELCTGKEPAGIGGLIWRENGIVRYNGDRAPVTDLDRVAFPSFSAFELDKYPYPGASKEITPMPIVTSRGCPYSCIYCPVKTAIGRHIRFRTPENILQEIKSRYDQGYRSLWIADDNFTINRKRVVEVCELILSSDLPGLRLGCGNGIRADLVDRELLELMRRAGFWYLAFGIESGSNSTLKNLKKGYCIEDAERGVREACELGFEVVLFFLLGSPGETEQDFRQSMALAERYPVADVRFYNLMPFPKTELYKWVGENGYFLRQPEDYLNDTISWQNRPVFETPEMPAPLKMRLFVEGEAVRKRVRRNRLVRRLEYLGLSSFIGRLMATVAIVGFIERLWRETSWMNRFVMALVRRKDFRSRRNQHNF